MVKTLPAARFGVRFMAGALALFGLGAPAVAVSQATVTVHGKVTNAAGVPLNKGDVKFSDESKAAGGDPKDRKYQYSFPLDATGNFKGGGLAPADYLGVVMVDGRTIDFQHVTAKAGEDKTVDFDMTRAEYLKSMSAEDKAALEEYKKKNAAVATDNAKIANINATLTKARADEKAGNPDEAVTALQGITTARPDEPIIWGALAEAQLASADLAYKNAKAAKTSTTDPAMMQKYADSAASYQKAVELSASKKTPPEVVGSYYQNMGSALAKAGKGPEAAAAYDASAKANPAGAGTTYYNEAANFFNMGKLDEAAAAADKTIAADPKRADAYYIKGQALIPKATLDAKTNKFLLPPGCLEAYQEYLELAPEGPRAGEVKELLANLGQPVKNSFKAGKK